jgi:Protein of unknown function (DUF1275)
MLLVAAGGYVDAFTFVGKGRVFATAMTDNVMIMGTLMLATNGNRLGPAFRRLRHLLLLYGAQDFRISHRCRGGQKENR